MRSLTPWIASPVLLAGALAVVAGLPDGARAEEPAPQPAAPQPAAPQPGMPQPGAPAAEQILGWINDLGSDDFRTREQASRNLAGAGEAAREALRTAVSSSDSLEVRWRAQQLLLRLDGKTERNVGEDSKPRLEGPRGPAGPIDPGLRELLESNDPSKIRQLIERMFKDLPQRGPWQEFGSSPWGVAPFGAWGDLTLGMRIVAGDLTLKRGMLGMGPWLLEVRGQDASGVEARKSYSGESLEQILEANPALKEHPSLADLKAKLEEALKREQPFVAPGLSWRDRLGPAQPGFTFKTSQGVEIRQDANGVLVRIHQQGPDGKPEVKEYKGESLEQIQREHPELADRIGGSIQLRFGPPRVFRGPREEPLPPVTPRAPAPAPAPQLKSHGPQFGVGLLPVEPALATHLKLLPGVGVLVYHVIPGSQAASLGLQVHDVIVALDSLKLNSADAAARLGEAARANDPLTLGIVRDGAFLTLSR